MHKLAVFAKPGGSSPSVGTKLLVGQHAVWCLLQSEWQSTSSTYGTNSVGPNFIGP